MKEKNKDCQTYKTIVKLITGSRLESKINEDLSNISFKKTSLGNYCIFVDDICGGIFVDKSLVSEAEMKELGWHLKGKME